MATSIPLKLDQANNRLCELESGVDCIDPSFQVQGVFGSEFQSVSEDTVSNTLSEPSLPNNITSPGSTFPEQYLTLTTPAELPAGNYLLTVSYMWNKDGTTEDFIGRILLDGTTVLMTHREEPQDSFGAGDADAPSGSGSNQRLPFHQQRVIPLTAGTHIFQLEFATGAAGDEASIIEGNITLWRAS